MKPSIGNDKDLGLIIVSALRYALPRHTYITGTTADFIRTHWQSKAIQKYRNIIMRDLKEWLDDNPASVCSSLEIIDRNIWQNLYNDLSYHETISSNTNNHE